MKNRIYLLTIIAGSILLSSSMSSVKLDKRMSKLKVKLDEAASYVVERNSKNPEVSEAAISWHIDHVFLVVNQIYKTVEQSEESNYKSEFNMIRSLVFTFNSMPRGKITAPESVSIMIKPLRRSRNCLIFQKKNTSIILFSAL